MCHLKQMKGGIAALLCVIFISLAIVIAGCTAQESPAKVSPSKSSVAPSSPVNTTSGTGGAQIGDTVDIDYTGTLENGSVFDSSKDRGPFSFTLGDGSAILGFDSNIQGMKVGQSKKFTVTPDEAYGYYDASKVKQFPIEFIPAEERGNVTIGQSVTLFNGKALVQATVTTLNSTNVTFDFNSPMVGKSLTFDVTLVNLTPGNSSVTN